MNKKLTRSYEKYGIDQMKFDVIYCMFSPEGIHEIEQSFIDEMNPQLNMSMVVNRPLSDPAVAERWRISAKNSDAFNDATMRNLKLASAKVKKKILRSDGMEFDSAVDAAHYMGYKYIRGKTNNPIAYAVRTKSRCKNGFFWKHQSTGNCFDEHLELERDRKYNKSIGLNARAVVRLTDGVVFPSAKIAAENSGIKQNNAICCAIKRNGIAGGHRWKYADT